jgi:tetratricopeptide (TPR) repeat protein
VLLDEQLIAFERVLAAARDGAAARKKAMILIRGGPGTGKSVIALNLLAQLSKEGFNTHYVTGSRAFTATLKEIVGKMAAQQCKNFSSYMEAGAEEIDVMVCDEAHRMWHRSKNRFIPKERQSGKLQIEELVHASRVTVFFIDDNQPVRPDEIGHSKYVLDFAKNKGAELFDYALEAQFRCSGSDAFINWVTNTLEVAPTPEVVWNLNNKFEFKTAVEIPISQFDVSLLPANGRDTAKPQFRDAVTEIFRSELRGVAETVQVAITQDTIRVGWSAKTGEAEAIELAIEKLKSGDYARGIQLLRVLVKRVPNDVMVRYNLGMALSDKGQLGEAIEHLSRAAELEPEAGNVLVARFRKGELREAKSSLEQALMHEPENPYALRNLGGCLLALEESPADAVKHLRKATDILPKDQQSWIGLGQALELLGEVEEADAALDKAIPINPHNDFAEVAKRARSKIAQKTMREQVGGELRMDAVMYCLAALKKCKDMPREQVQKIAFEIAAVGTKGINPNDPDKIYRLRTIEGDFTGLQLLSYMWVTWKIVAPEMNTGFDLKREYEAALELQKRMQK